MICSIHKIKYKKWCKHCLYTSKYYTIYKRITSLPTIYHNPLFYKVSPYFPAIFYLFPKPPHLDKYIYFYSKEKRFPHNKLREQVYSFYFTYLKWRTHYFIWKQCINCKKIKQTYITPYKGIHPECILPAYNLHKFNDINSPFWKHIIYNILPPSPNVYPHDKYMLIPQDFYRDKTTLDGWNNKCIDCHPNKQRIEWPEEWKHLGLVNKGEYYRFLKLWKQTYIS
jgi:hypothetical protein